MSELKRTALYDVHVAAGASMVDFGGWEMPIQYPEKIVTEHLYPPSLSVNPQELDFPGKLPVGTIIYKVEKNVHNLMWPCLHLWFKPDTAIPTKWRTAHSTMTKAFFLKQFNLNKVKNLKKLGHGENPKEHTT